MLNTALSVDTSARKPRPDTDTSGALNLSVPNSASAFASSDAAPGQNPALKRVAFVGALEDEGGGDAEAQNGSYRLNFENADIRGVVQAVLGETLRQNYTMTEDVSGKVTISSPRSLTAQELLSALESALNANGFSMTKAAGGYRIAPSAVGGGVVDTPFSTQPSFGVSVVPLRHVSAATMGRLISGFVTETDGLRVDAARNAVVVRGPGAKRQEAVQAIMSFDADWMQNQAVGLYEVRQATPEAVVSELNRVFDSQQAGAAGGVIQFKPISRLRAVMVVTKNPGLLKRAESWVKRLDRDSASGGENVFVYKARYRDSKELARIITSLFRAGGDGGRGASKAGTDSPSTSGSGSGFGGSADDGFGGASGGSSASPSARASGAFQNVRSSATGGGAASAFNNPNFDAPPDGQAGEGGSSAGAAGSLDLTTKEASQSSNLLVSSDPANNAVVVYSDGYTYQKILSALRQLDSAPLQVAIQATIAEVQLNDNMKQGVEYFVKSNSVGLGKDKGSVSLFGGAANTLQKQIPGFNVLLGANSNADVIISALDQVTNVEVLSSPSLVVAENQPANFQVGDEVPITVRQAQSVENVDSPLVNQIEFRDTGVILNVTPRIGTNDAVTMQIEQEISAVVGGGDSLTPTISKRRVKSNISVTSGQTVLLAGLISKRNERGKNGIPILGDLPAVGALFSQRNSSLGRTELVVFIRPTVIRNGEDAASVADEFRSRLMMNKAAAAVTK
ncbi:type II secretion system secretin GspD [Hansschlegelia sp. KR7-227]|uniref:type II secretion system secretin GspD n=1 Tax=Hansschlegelia sp. KR7-227 TaxID=3400914 RepID=UPI003C0AD97A